MNAIGAPLTRVDGPAKVTGDARYAAEFHPDGLVYAATHNSTVPAGRITALDTAAAERAPGVLLVLTHLNADRLSYQAPAEPPAVDAISGEQLHVLQDAEIRFSGRPRALVVATTQAQALYAASLVRVTYAPEPDCLTQFDPGLAKPTSEAAARKGCGPETKQGDPDAAFAAAPVRVDAIYLQAREQHNAMEPHVTVAEWQGERLTL